MLQVAKKREPILLILLITMIIMFSGCDEESPVVVEKGILEKLRELDGITVKEIQPESGYTSAFELKITQPLDHNNPDGIQFEQTMYLYHVSDSAPMVFSPSGYYAVPGAIPEVAELLQANSLSVTHRFFRGAEPDPIDWEYLRVKQAAADHHRIVEKLKTIYTGPWVSTGGSKSGITAVYHYWLYPEDVSAVVAFVAPFSISTTDERYVPYINSIGTEAERNRIKEYQRELLQGRDTYIPMMVEYIEKFGLTFSSDPDEEFESEVSAYWWSFWQYYSINPKPTPEKDAEEQAKFDQFAEVCGITGISDEAIKLFTPFAYQVYAEMGYPVVDDRHLEDLYISGGYSTVEFFKTEYGVDIVFDPSIGVDVIKWIQNHGNNILFIYGALDPFTGGAIELTGNTNAIRIIREGQDHLLKIEDLPRPQMLVDTIREWMGTDITTQKDYGIKASKVSADRELSKWYHKMLIRTRRQ